MIYYTEALDFQAETLSPDEEGYEERLLEIASLFRDFGEAFTAFLVEHGYKGDVSDVEAKAEFLRERYKMAGIKTPRDFKEWFRPNKQLKRETMIPICFVFQLGLEETNEFLRCVCLERGLDCHTLNEAIYYFCIKNKYSYHDAKELIDRIPKLKKIKAIPKQEILYTGTVREYVDSIKEKEQLVEYLTENRENFQYNNVTAIQYIKELWGEISIETSEFDGWAVKESHFIDEAYNRFEMKADDYALVNKESSTWSIFSQIVGLRNYQKNEYGMKYNRSLATVLSSNALMPLNASYCFPSQHSIDKVLRGEQGENEIVRKILILLIFYKYWVEKIVENGDIFYEAKRRDAAECLETIDQYLLDAGYPALYAGNPYDWIFKWSLNSEHPLEAFRTYMGEVFVVKEE